MKHPNIVDVVDKILYLTGQQGTSYRGTKETAASSDTLWNPGIFFWIVRQVTPCYHLLHEHIHSPLQKDYVSLLCESNKSQLIYWSCCKINHPKMTFSVDEATSVYVNVYISICVCVYICIVYMCNCPCKYIYKI